jgi:hypothetical protein
MPDSLVPQDAYFFFLNTINAFFFIQNMEFIFEKSVTNDIPYYPILKKNTFLGAKIILEFNSCEILLIYNKFEEKFWTRKIFFEIFFITI